MCVRFITNASYHRHTHTYIKKCNQKEVCFRQGCLFRSSPLHWDVCPADVSGHSPIKLNWLEGEAAGWAPKEMRAGRSQAAAPFKGGWVSTCFKCVTDQNSVTEDFGRNLHSRPVYRQAGKERHGQLSLNFTPPASSFFSPATLSLENSAPFLTGLSHLRLHQSQNQFIIHWKNKTVQHVRLTTMEKQHWIVWNWNKVIPLDLSLTFNRISYLR